MIIGFLSADLGTLSFFKKTVQEYPLHGYVFYCDTSNTLNVGGEALENGVAYVTGKGCTVVVVEDDSMLEPVQSVKSGVTVFTSDSLQSFLASADTQQEAESTIRTIHLTEHTEETDQKIREILGGFFISEEQ